MDQDPNSPSNSSAGPERPAAAPPARAAEAAKVNYDGPKAKQLAQDCIEAVRKDTARLDRDKQDWLNVLGYHGGEDNWWVTWDSIDNVWRRLPDDDGDYGLPAEVPRQASNMYRRKIDGIASILNQSAPAQEWRPSKDDDASRATAEIIEDALPVLRDECGYTRDRNLINLHVVLTDKVGYEVYYDNDEKYGTQQIDALQCQDPACGWQGMPQEVEDAGDTCPSCGTPGDNLGPALNPLTAEPLGVHYPKGKVCGRLIPSFEISLPPNARECRVDRVPYIVTHTWMPREDGIRMWPNAADKIRQAKGEVSSANTSSQYASAVRNISSPHAAARGIMPQTIDAITVWRVVHDPIDDEVNGYQFPEGLDLVLIDGEVIDAGPLPLKDDQGQPIKPIALRQYVAAPGSPFGIPPADDLGVLQRQRNLLETLLILILLHDASPRTYVPLTVTLEDEITGKPGETIRYRSNMPGDKPHTDPGVNPPEGLYKALEMNDKAFDTISGLNAVLEGQHEEGVNTLGEAQRLLERGMVTFKSPLDHLIEFEKDVSYLLLQTARQSMWTARLIRSVGENGEWDIKQFTNADLHGSVDVYVNPISAWPKSNLLQQLRLQDAVKMGVVDIHDPEIQEQILSDYDLSHLKGSLDIDRKQLARELDRWKTATTPDAIKPVGPYVNVPLHLLRKSNWMKTEEAEALQQAHPDVWAAMNQHIQQLQQQIAQKQAEMQKNQTGKGGDHQVGVNVSIKGDMTDPMARQIVAGAAKADGIDVDPNTPAPADTSAKGPDGSVLEQHLAAGHLHPAGPHRSPLPGLIEKGVIRPSAPPPAAAGMPPGPGAPPA